MPYSLDIKLTAFEYLLSQMMAWHEAETGSAVNDLSVLKVSKLTFFTTAADCRTLEDSFLVTEVFDNYVAMPYGHVESNIYSQLKAKAGQLSNIQITKSSATYLPDGSKESILEVLAPYPEIVQRIDDAHQKLRSINPKLITMKPFYLVDLSHTWFSWKKNYAAATTSGRYSESIPAVDIITEEKYYFLY